MTAREQYDALAAHLKAEWEKHTAAAKAGEARLAAIVFDAPQSPPLK
jgi:hypothetical protein